MGRPKELELELDLGLFCLLSVFCCIAGLLSFSRQLPIKIVDSSIIAERHLKSLLPENARKKLKDSQYFLDLFFDPLFVKKKMIGKRGSKTGPPPSWSERRHFSDG